MDEEDNVNVETLDNNEDLDESQVIEEVNVKETTPEENPQNENNRLKFPLRRIKTIMENDPDCHMIKKDALLLVSKATEMFLEFLGKEAFKYCNKTKRKTMMRKDVDAAIDSVPNLCFLEGALETES